MLEYFMVWKLPDTLNWYLSITLVAWNGRWRLQRNQREPKTPQERAFCDEEAEAAPAGKRPSGMESNGIIKNLHCP